MMQAVILVGGEGTRLRPLTDTRPKPMMTLVDRPFVEHQLDHLRRFGITDVIFSCGYLPRAIQDYFGTGQSWGMTLHYVIDPEPLGTAGAVKNAEELLTSDRILVLNGDVLTDLDVAALVDQHERAEVDGTIALTPVDDPAPYGLVRLHADHRVAAFVEKPAPDQLLPNEPYLINAGTYLLEHAVVDGIPAGRPGSIERDIFPALAAEGKLAGYPSDCYWRDIGTPDSYLQAHLDVLGGVVRTDSPMGDAYVGAGCSLAADARVTSATTVGTGSVVASGAVIERSVIGSGVAIGENVHIRGAIIGSDVIVGADAQLGAGVVVGDNAVIASGAKLVEESIPTGPPRPSTLTGERR